MNHDACRRAEELMPWVLAATADPEERAFVSRHVAACEACRSELREVAALQKRVRESVSGLPGLTRDEQQLLLSVLPATKPDTGSDLLRSVASLIEAFGVPALVSRYLAEAADLHDRRPTIRIDVPCMPCVEVGP